MNKIKTLLFFLLLISVKLSAQNYYLPAQSPFTHNAGICYNVLSTKWFSDPSITYDADKKIKCSTDRLLEIIKRFKLVRVYAYLVPGWEQTGDLDPNGAALVNAIKADGNVEGVFGTSNNKGWYMNQENVNTYISKLKDALGDNVSQVKCLLIGNEVERNGWTAADITSTMDIFKSALKDADWSVPVTITMGNLPVQPQPDVEAYVDAVVGAWDEKWNGGFPFVFIDPYPDAPGINNPAGVFDWQSRATTYFQKKYPKFQIFIGETGAEGAGSDAAALPIVNGLLSELDKQYQAKGKTVPTFLMEGLNEPLKPGTPNQTFMGVFQDSDNPMAGSSITVKSGTVIPAWIK